MNDIEIDQLKPTDIIVLVMGKTGSGKSTFIQRATRRDDVVVGHDLHSQTKDLRVLAMADPKDGRRRLVLVDTVGSDDDQLETSDVIIRTTSWLANAWESGLKLSGILFFHSVVETRMTGSSVRHLEMFQKLVGQESLRNVVLVTSLWSRVQPPELGDRREKTLLEDYWQDMMAYDAQYSRFLDTYDSAMKVIDLLRSREPTVTQVQRELVDQQLLLSETSAGRLIDGGLAQLLRDQQLLLQDLMQKQAAASVTGDQKKRQIYDRNIVQAQGRLARIEEKRGRLAEKRLYKLELRALKLQYQRDRAALRYASKA